MRSIVDKTRWTKPRSRVGLLTGEEVNLYGDSKGKYSGETLSEAGSGNLPMGRGA